MEPAIERPDVDREFLTPERCWILETWNTAGDAYVSIARARVEAGETTQLHSLSVDERYLIVAGRGIMTLGMGAGAEVGPGDVVAIPAGTPQQIRNDTNESLIFYAICSPRFTPSAYRNLEDEESGPRRETTNDWIKDNPK